MLDPIVITILVVVLTVIAGAVFMISSPKKSHHTKSDIPDTSAPLTDKSRSNHVPKEVETDIQVDPVSEKPEINVNKEAEGE